MGGILDQLSPKEPKSSMGSFIYWGGGGLYQEYPILCNLTTFMSPSAKLCIRERYLIINVWKKAGMFPSNEVAVSYPLWKVVAGVKTLWATDRLNCTEMAHLV